jgi:serine/threonine protein kinase/tetratricopeptide (TPR) repeat protein
MATLIGQELGGYRIISQVGKGGMATVYKAFQPSLDRYVAVKVMPPFYAQEDETFIKRFKREAQSIAKLRHPNILLVIDFGEHDGLIYIVMEFVDAGTLTEQMGKPIPEDHAVKILDQVASALDYAHMQGLVHRDVKPSNILLPKPDWPLLTDFGLAKIVGGSQLTITGTIAGTPAYMSPEQGQGESVDSRSDIYSLGIVLYEMMTGGVPYHAETPMAVVVKHIIEPLPMPRAQNPDISESIERVILKALAKDPDDRYQRTTDLAQAFRDAVEESIIVPIEKPTMLDEVSQEPIVETIVDPWVEGDSVSDRATSVESVEPEKAPPISYPQEIPEVTPSIPPKPAKGLIQQRPWLKWFIPAGAAATALCAIGLLLAFVIIPSIRDNVGTGTVIPSTLTVEDRILEGHRSFEAGDYEAAIFEYESAIAQGTDDPEVFFSLASSYLEMDRVEEALSIVDQVVRTNPEEAWVHESAGTFYQNIEYHYEAISEFERALELNPENTWVRELLAESYRAVGEYGKAEEILSQGEEPKVGEDPYQLESQGWEHYYDGNLEQAEEAFRRAVEIDPHVLGAWEGLADIYFYQDDLDRAIRVLEQGIEANEEEAYLYEKLGWIYYYTDDTEQAEWAFNNAVYYDPYFESAWEGLAEVYWYLGDYETAISTIETAITNLPESPVLYEKLGWLHYDNWDYDAAIDTLEHAISLDPDWTDAYSTLADVWYELGEVEQAIAVLESGVAANPNRSDVRETLGWYYYEFGRYQESIEVFEEAIAITPENGWPYVGLASSYTILENWEGAISALNNADKYSYDDPSLLLSIGWGYVDLGDCTTAMEYFERILTIDPYDEGAQEGMDFCSS